jgi:hypothetical protein
VVPRRRPRAPRNRPPNRARRLIGEPVTFGVHPEDYEHFLRHHGFRIIDLALASELHARYAPDIPAVIDDSLYVLAAERVSTGPSRSPARLRWVSAQGRPFG